MGHISIHIQNYNIPIMGTSWLPSYEALPGEVQSYHWDVDDLGTWNPWNPFGWCPIEKSWEMSLS